jgi:hypothetical protein
VARQVTSWSVFILSGCGQVLAMGIDKYNDACRAVVDRNEGDWQRTTRRLGRWISFDRAYKTMDPSFMESVWWVFKQIYEKGLVYQVWSCGHSVDDTAVTSVALVGLAQGYKVMPYSTACGTPLSNFEAKENYKMCKDPAVVVSFPLKDDPDNASMLVWTTTPWSLPANVALCVNPDLVYVKVRDRKTGQVRAQMRVWWGMSRTDGLGMHNGRCGCWQRRDWPRYTRSSGLRRTGRTPPSSARSVPVAVFWRVWVALSSSTLLVPPPGAAFVPGLGPGGAALRAAVPVLRGQAHVPRGVHRGVGRLRGLQRRHGRGAPGPWLRRR